MANRSVSGILGAVGDPGLFLWGPGNAVLTTCPDGGVTAQAGFQAVMLGGVSAFSEVDNVAAYANDRSPAPASHGWRSFGQLTHSEPGTTSASRSSVPARQSGSTWVCRSSCIQRCLHSRSELEEPQGFSLAFQRFCVRDLFDFRLRPKEGSRCCLFITSRECLSVHLNAKLFFPMSM